MVFPFLYMGATLALTQSDGNFPVFSDWLHKKVRIGAISSASSLRMWQGRSSGPAALFTFREDRSFAIPRTWADGGVWGAGRVRQWWIVLLREHSLELAVQDVSFLPAVCVEDAFVFEGGYSHAVLTPRLNKAPEGLAVVAFQSVDENVVDIVPSCLVQSFLHFLLG